MSSHRQPLDSLFTQSTSDKKLSSTSQLLNGVGSFQSASEQILRKIGQALGWKVGGLWAFNPTLKALKCESFWTADPIQYQELELITRTLALEPELGLPGQVWQQEVEFVSYSLQDCKLSPRRLHCLEAGLTHVFLLPVKNHGQLFAVLEFFSETEITNESEIDQLISEFKQELIQLDSLQHLETALFQQSQTSANLQSILEGIEDGILVLDSGQTCIFINEVAQHFFQQKQGYSYVILEQDSEPTSIIDLLSTAEVDAQEHFNLEQLSQLFSQTSGNHQPMELLFSEPETEQKTWLKITPRPLKSEDDQEKGTILICRDITQRKEFEQKVLQDSLYDSLTKLGNRTLFLQVLDQSLQLKASDPQFHFAVLFVDINRFKIINDSLGHLMGDQLIIAIAQRLQTCLRKEDVITRFGGDEFAILLKPLKTFQFVPEIAQRLHKALIHPFQLGDQEIYIHVSIGVALSNEETILPEDYIRNASTAMYQAKKLGKGGYQIFDQTLATQAVHDLKMESDLQKALDQQQFRLHYQPIVSLSNQAIVGFEALIRWYHPEQGWVSPGQFIPIAEDSGLILPIGQWVLETACEQMKRWQQQFPEIRDWVMSVNVSSRQLSHPNFIQWVESILRKTQLHPTSLKLEITESLLFEGTQDSITLLKQLRNQGLKLALDDFGTGYSSLSYLHQFSFDTLKIDRSFIQIMEEEQGKLAIIRAIVSLASYLEMDVVAEGIEEGSQLAHLKVLKCAYGQGYFFSKPLEEMMVENLIRQTLAMQKPEAEAEPEISLPEKIAKEHLLLHIEKLSQELEELKQEKNDLEIMLEMTAEHAEIFEAELQEELLQYQEVEVELQKRNEQLEHLSFLDGLTQVSNRRHFDLYIEEQWEHLSEEEQPLSLIIGDIDCFKQFNDTYGHPAGDDCLIQVAKILSHPIKPPVDMVARYGGEEFALVLPNTNAGGALEIAQEIQRELKKLQMPHQNSFVKPYVTLSLGIVSLVPHAGETIETMIYLADKALYDAKKQGRDRFILCSM